MATRVIDNRRDWLTTILVAPLMTYSARIPIYTLIISAFIPNRLIWGGLSPQGLVFFGPYALGLMSTLFLVWYVFAPQCASTLGVVKRETNSWLRPAVMFAYMSAPAYAAAFATFNVASATGAG